MNLIKPRPEVVISNAPEVYGFYGEYQPNKVANWVLHSMLTTVFLPHEVSFTGNAERDIRSHLKDGGQIVMPSNHIKDTDPCAIAAMAVWKRALRGLVGGETIIPAKSPIFHDLAGKHDNINWLLRHAVDILNAKPTFRAKDWPEGDPHLPGAYRLFMNMSFGQLKNGKNMVVFAEEERNKVDPHVVQSLKSGFGHMVFRLPEAQRAGLALATMGLYYGENWFRPTVKIDELVTADAFGTRRELLDWTATSMQECVDGAVDMYEQAA